MEKRMIKSLLAAMAFFLLVASLQVSASSYKIESSADKLEILEQIGNVLASVTEKEIPELKSGSITAKGNTQYNQYLRFSGLTYPRVEFQKDMGDTVSDMLYVQRNTGAANAFFEYELEFAQNLISDIKNTNLEDLDGLQIYIFNEPYTIVLGKVDGNKVILELIGGAFSELVEEGQTKQFTVGEKTFTIKVTSIEESTKKVKLNVNGADLAEMIEGETESVDGTFIGISKVLTSSSGGSRDMTEIFIGAKVIKLVDSNHKDSNFEEGVEIDKEKINGAFVNIIAENTGSTLDISKIRYRLTSADDIYVKKDEMVSSYLKTQKKGLLANWDLRYGGLSTGAANTIAFTPTSGKDEYRITFKNKNGNTFTNIPFLSNMASFKLGDSNDNFVVAENTNIEANDYFVITDRNDKTGTTYIMRYNSIDTTSKHLKIFDYATNSEKTFAYQNSSASGQIGTVEILAGSLKANTTILSSSGNPLNVDLNTDGSIGSSLVYLVTIDGGVLVTQSLSGSTYTLQLRTESSMFEENATNENIQFVFESRSGNKIGIQSTFTGITTHTLNDKIMGLSAYGVSMEYYQPGNSEAETLNFIYPKSQKFAETFIDVGAAQVQTQEVVKTEVSGTSCSNGILDGDETGVDCGGSCASCASTGTSTASCSDGILNQNEISIDCGGPCGPCIEELCPGQCSYLGADGLEVCLSAGESTDAFYCSKEKKIKLKKSNSLACEEDYECKIDICENNKCGKYATSYIIGVNVALLIAFMILLFHIIEVLMKKT